LEYVPASCRCAVEHFGFFRKLDRRRALADQIPTATPIKYLVVIFQEMNSFDHYFATYRHAENPSGEPSFNAWPGTPSVNGLTKKLRQFNSNSIAPYRLDRSDESTCENDNDYNDEQKACGGELLGQICREHQRHGRRLPGGPCHFQQCQKQVAIALPRYPRIPCLELSPASAPRHAQVRK
jgi:hypothetical protein